MKVALFAAVIFLFFTLSACKEESNPVRQEDHFEPTGWVFEDSSGTPLLVIWQAAVQNSWNNQPLSSKLLVSVNDTTGIIYIKFLDENRNILPYPEEEDLGLSWTIVNPAIGSMELSIISKWGFRIFGNTPGTTKVEFKVLHGEHSDVRTPEFDLEVTP